MAANWRWDTALSVEGRNIRGAESGDLADRLICELPQSNDEEKNVKKH